MTTALSASNEGAQRALALQATNLAAAESPDVLVVGAGPVGLWTAVNAKLQNPALKILIFERYEQYVRNNTLNIQVRSLSGASQDPRLQAIIANWRHNSRGSKIKIPTLTIQNDLAKLARELGIQIQTRTIGNAKALADEFPTARCIVGADGSHSVVQTQFFDSQMWFDEVLNYTVLFKYKARNNPQEHGLIASYQASKLAGTFVDEHVSSVPNSDGTYNVTLQLFLDEQTVSSISGFNFKNPATIRDLQTGAPASTEITDADLAKQEIARKVMTWLATKKLVNAEDIVEGSDSLSAVPLRSYCSKKWVVEHQAADGHRVSVALAGDSAMGVPFFRSLNNGLKGGIWLSNQLAQIKSSAPVQGSSSKMEPLPSFSGYTRRMTLLAIRELLFAKIKSVFIKCLQMFIAISAKLFWQIFFWKKQSRTYIEQAAQRSIDHLIATPVPLDQVKHYPTFRWSPA